MLELAIVDQFGDAIDFILHQRESVSGGVEVGGLEELGRFTLTHVAVSVVAIVAAIAVSLPIGLYLGHTGRGEFLAIAVSNAGRAVPALALLAFFLAYLGPGVTNVTVVLFLLAVPPILANTYVGIREVDPDAVDAARGMGMTETRLVRRIELPLALPTIVAGIRLGAVAVVATATIAPLADVRTLGEPIIASQIYGAEGQLGASIIVALVALAVDRGILLAQRGVTPEGLRLARGEGRPRRLSLRRLLPSNISTRRERTT